MAAKRVYKTIVVCKECGEARPHMAKGLCKRCYGRLWWRENNDYQGKKYHYPGEDFVCNGCGKRSKHVGNGLCQKCSTRARTELLRTRTGVCARCGKAKKIRSAGMCSRCCQLLGQNIVRCGHCQEDRLHHAKGLCVNCYAKHFEKQKLETGRLIVCEICQEEKVHHAKGLCPQCYRRLHKKTWAKKTAQCGSCGKDAEHMAKGLCTRCYFQSVGGQKYNHQRNSRKQGLPASLTHDEWKDILGKYDYSCAYCGTSGVRLAQEHWIPLSRGGGYTADNIVPACKSCNSRKHTMTGDEYLDLLKREHEYIQSHSG